MTKEKHILLGVTGSIAAYKAAELVRLICKRKWIVSVIMTRSATRFVTELTFRTLSRQPVVTDIFEPVENWKPEHVALAERANAMIIAPCTANIIAKLAHGIADDALTATALACSAPLIIVPAMNENMWNHPATKENVRILKSRGVLVVGVEKGKLACGYTGWGHIAAGESIIKALEQAMGSGL